MRLKLKNARDAFTVVDHVQASGISESSQFVRLRAEGTTLVLTLTGTLRAEAKVTGPATASPVKENKWVAYVDRRAFKAFLATATNEWLEIFFGKNKVLVMKAGQRLEAAEHASILGYESWVPQASFSLTDKQKIALKTMVKYLPKIDGAEHVDAVAFQKDFGMIATDTLCIMAVLDGSCPTSLFLPTTVAQVLAGADGWFSKVSADKAGVGALLDAGFVYQPLSADLDRFPTSQCHKVIADAQKSPRHFKAKAADLLSTLSVASQFLVDNTEEVVIKNSESGLMASVNLAGGKFQRIVPTAEPSKLPKEVSWPVHRVLPWLEHAVAVKTDIPVEYAKLNNMSMLRFTAEKQQHLLMFADL